MSLFSDYKKKPAEDVSDLDNKGTNTNILFNFITDIWKPLNIKKYNNFDKQKVSFMLNRFLSIKYPIQSSLLSHQNIIPSSLVNWWVLFLQMVYKNKPNFFYTKTKGTKEVINKNSKKPIFKEGDFSEDVIEFLKMRYNIWDNKTWEDIKENQTDELIKELKQIEKDLK